MGGIPCQVEPNKVLWSTVMVGSDQSMNYDVFLKLFLTVHQLLWWGLMSGPYLRRAGVIGLHLSCVYSNEFNELSRVIGLQVLYILKQGESGKASSWGDLHLDSVGSSDLQNLEGSQPLGGQLLAW
jgi:hypothetical protein